MSSQAVKNITHFSKFLTGHQIRQERISKNYSISKLAEAIQVTPFMLKGYEEGSRRIPLMHLLLIQKALSVGLEKFLPSVYLEKDTGIFDKESFPVDVEAVDPVLLILFFAKNKDASLKRHVLKIVHYIRSQKAFQSPRGQCSLTSDWKSAASSKPR